MSQRLVLFVEGQTEEESVAAFLKRWLDPWLDSPVGIATVRFEGWSEFVRDAPDKARFRLDIDPKRDEIIAVIGLLDLYGPTFYPDHVASVKDRYAWGKQHIEHLVDHSRYHQFFAVHETEAWLLSDPSRFAPQIRNALTPKAKAPETVNFNEPPAKLLNRIYLQETNRGYKKRVEARNRFPHLSPELACAACPYLQRMMDDLLEIVKTARQ